MNWWLSNDNKQSLLIFEQPEHIDYLVNIDDISPDELKHKVDLMDRNMVAKKLDIKEAITSINNNIIKALSNKLRE